MVAVRLTAKHVKRLVTLVVGGSVVLLGIAMLVLPGPALLVIPVGVVILAGEFAWARRLRRRVEELASSFDGAVTGQPPASRERAERANSPSEPSGSADELN